MTGFLSDRQRSLLTARASEGEWYAYGRLGY